jgi:type VI secretion system protein ImpJ
MFLRPQQFQAMDRARAEELAAATAASDPCSYGIVRVEINPTALAARQFELRRCQARLRDGTLIWLEQGEEPDRLSLERAGEQMAALSRCPGSIRPVPTCRPRGRPIAAGCS